MNAIDRLAVNVMRPFRGATSSPGFTFSDWLGLWGPESPFFVGSNLRQDDEKPSPNLLGMASVFARNSVVYSTFMTRAKLFSQARFQFQQMHGGHEGALFGTAELGVLENPEPGETTIDLNMRVILDADLAGDGFIVRRKWPASRGRVATDRAKRLRPDWTIIALGSRNPDADPADLPQDPDAEIIGYGYQPGGPGSGGEMIAFGPDEVAHFHPNPNPLSMYRGMPLILAALPEIMADISATQHKRAFFNNAATPQLALAFPPTMDKEVAAEWIKIFEGKHAGAKNAYRAMYLGNGITPTAVGANFQEMTFSELQGKAETRITAVAGIHPVVSMMSEGLAGSSLNAGNFGSAARATADITLRFLWSNWCGSLGTIIPSPKGTRLWYDERSIPFLQADVKDRATTRASDADTINKLVMVGYEPDSVRDAVINDDMSLLVHTGLPSVQLQGRPAEQQSTVDFTPANGALDKWGAISAGEVLPWDHPLVLSYPSLFAAKGARAEISTSAVALLGPGSELRCQNCKKLLAEAVSPPYRLQCRHCKHVNEASAPAALVPVVPETKALVARGAYVPPLERAHQAAAEREEARAARQAEADERRELLAREIEDRRDERAAADRAVQMQLIAVLAARPAPSVTIAEGAVQTPVRVESPVSFADGAIRTEVHVDAPPPAQVTISEGAVQMPVHIESPVAVAAAPAPNVTIAEGAFQIAAAPAPNVTIAEGAVQVPIRIDSPVSIAEGAIHTDVHVDAPPPAQMSIAEGAVQVHVDAPPAANVTVEAPPPASVTIAEGAVQVRVEAPVTVEAQPIPEPEPSKGLRIVRTPDGGATVEEIS